MESGPGEPQVVRLLLGRQLRRLLRREEVPAEYRDPFDAHRSYQPNEQLRSSPWETVNWLIMNEGEVDGLFAALDPSGDLDRAGVVIPSTWPQDPILSRAHELLHALRSLPDFPNSVNLVCTLGSLGVLTLPASSNENGERNDAIYVPATRLEDPVIDTTGAGDCFTGYFVAGCMRHWAENEGSEPGRNELEGIVKLAVQVRYSIVR